MIAYTDEFRMLIILMKFITHARQNVAVELVLIHSSK